MTPLVRSGTRRGRLIGLAAAGVLIGGLSAPGAARESTQPRSRGMIAFESGCYGQIDTLALADGTLRRVSRIPITDGTFGTSPTWSPDGRRIAYAATVSGDAPLDSTFTGEVRVIDVRARTDTVLYSVPAAFIADTTWSPDGRNIAFWLVTPGPFGQATVSTITVVSVRDGSARTVAAGEAPGWSPDGRRLAYTDYRTGAVFSASVEHSGSARRISPPGVYGGPPGVVKNYPDQPSAPAWSPSGRWIAFNGVRSRDMALTDDDPDKWHVWLVRPDGSRAHQLRDAGGTDITPTWSPDGASLAYTDDAGVRVSAATGDHTRLLVRDRGTHDPVNADVAIENLAPAWSPDGKAIAYERIVSDGYYEIHLVSPSGANDRIVLWYDRCGAWWPLAYRPR